MRYSKRLKVISENRRSRGDKTKKLNKNIIRKNSEKL